MNEAPGAGGAGGGAVAPSLGRHGPPRDRRHVLVWRFAEAVHALSSAPVGGGWTTATWVLNAGVSSGYARTDLDTHVAEIAREVGLGGAGIGLLTAADVRRRQRRSERNVTVDATVGVTSPTWAADEDGASASWLPGTINVVVQFPVPLTAAAAVGAVVTVTEAKAQALAARGVPGTGTASDAVCILWPDRGEPEVFAGPRSPLGAPLARATYAAVVAGIDGWRP